MEKMTGLLIDWRNQESLRLISLQPESDGFDPDQRQLAQIIGCETLTTITLDEDIDLIIDEDAKREIIPDNLALTATAIALGADPDTHLYGSGAFFSRAPNWHVTTLSNAQQHRIAIAHAKAIG